MSVAADAFVRAADRCRFRQPAHRQHHIQVAPQSQHMCSGAVKQQVESVQAKRGVPISPREYAQTRIIQKEKKTLPAKLEAQEQPISKNKRMQNLFFHTPAVSMMRGTFGRIGQVARVHPSNVSDSTK
jgi:hypothetical protein